MASIKFSGFTAGGALGDTDEVVGLSTAQNRRWTLLQVWTYISGKVSAVYAPLASAALTGNPTAPTQTAGNRSTRLATTEFVNRDHWWVAGRGADIVHTGTTAPTALATITIPAGTMGVTGQVRVTVQTRASANNVNAKTVRLRFGGSAFQQFSLASTLTNRFQRQIANKGVANAQVSYPAGAGSDGSANAAASTMAIDTSIAFNIVIEVELANAGDTVTLDYYTVEVLY